MKKKILLFDLQHYEMMNVWLSIFSGQEYQLHLMTSKGIAERVQIKNINRNIGFTILEDFSSFQEFLNDFKHKNPNPDLIIFNTIDRQYRLMYKFIRQFTSSKIIVTIHNLNTWLKPPLTLNRTALSNYRWRAGILKNTHGIVVQEEEFIPYVKTTKHKYKHITAVPHTFPEDFRESDIQDSLKIAIPGAIDGNMRRNYNDCIQIIEFLSEINKNISFTFAGPVSPPYGTEIQSKLMLLIENGIKINFVYDPSSNIPFDEAIHDCNLILMPVNVHTRYEGIPEEYGRTKVTGVMYDAMRFRKPLLLPANIVVPKTIKSSTLSYQSPQVAAKIISSFITQPETLAELQKNSLKNATYYSLENIQKRVLPYIDEILAI